MNAMSSLRLLGLLLSRESNGLLWSALRQLDDDWFIMFAANYSKLALKDHSYSLTNIMYIHELPAQSLSALAYTHNRLRLYSTPLYNVHKWQTIGSGRVHRYKILN